MATKQFAIPLNSQSVQTGDITFKQLADASQPVTFQLSNAKSGSADELNLITTKGGSQISHKYTATVVGGSAAVDLTASQVQTIYGDTDGADWDYVQAHWSVGEADNPSPSNHYEIQSGHTYDTHNWPPKPKN